MALAIMLGMVFVLELTVWRAVSMRVQIVSVGRASFGVVFPCVLFFIVALLLWVLYVICVLLTSSERVGQTEEVVLTFPGWVGLVALLVLFMWWFCRVCLAVTLKPRAERARRGRRWLEETVGLRSEVKYRLDLMLLKDRVRLDLYFKEGVRIPDELAAVADLVAPKKYVMSRGTESENLRDYLSDVVRLSLPSMLVRRDALPKDTKPFVVPRGGSDKRR